MARTKEFEPESALERARDLFWLQGYEATSVQELLDCMGINRGSLYGTFGDKHALFMAALDRYAEAAEADTVEALEGSGPVRSRIEEVFERAVEGLSSDYPRRGCLLANSAVELGPHDPEVAGRVTRHLERTVDTFHRALVRARTTGEVPQDTDPRALARLLVNNLQGLRVMAKAGASKEVMDDVVRLTLAALD